MAKIIGKKIKWVASSAADLVAHNLYVCKDTETLTYDTQHVTVNMPAVEYILPGIFSITTEGTFKIGLTAVDDMGNESDMVNIASPFDFIAPSAPSGLQVINL